MSSRVKRSVAGDADLMREWDYKKNLDFDPDSISKWSRKHRVWWICEKQHSWEAFPGSRAGSGSKCPYCAGKKASLENSLSVKFPEIASTFHPKKNGSLTPNELTPFSNKSVWWHCHKGHEWETRVAYRTKGSGCPFCWKHTSKPEKRILAELEFIFETVERRYKSLGMEADIFLPSIKVAIEYDGSYWHKSIRQRDEEKNRLLESQGIMLLRVREAPLEKIRDHDILYGDRDLPKRVVDKILRAIQRFCSREESSRINKYIESDQFCRESEYQKYLSELSAIGDDDRLDLCEPEVVKYWNTQRNGELSPADFSRGSDHKVWWRCPRGHEWEAKIGSRTIGKTGCPICSGNQVSPANSLAVAYPEVAAQWDKKRNGVNTPDNFAPKSGYKAWWICNRNHSYQAAISSRTHQNSGCTICSGRSVIPETSLQGVRPELLKYWDYEANSILPSELSPKSGRTVSWICDKGHRWALPPCNFKGRSCPYCDKKANSIGSAHPEIANEWHPTKNGGISPWNVSRGTRAKYWWRCEFGHVWSASPNVRTRARNPLSCPECKRLFKKRPD